LKQALSSLKLKSAWKALTPLAKNEWICWVTSAKRKRRGRSELSAQTLAVSGFYGKLFGMTKFFFLLFCFFTFFTNSEPTFADSAIPRFSRVAEGLYRGGRPTEQDLEYLARGGFKTVISLERIETTDWEEPIVKGLGMRFVSIPLDVYKTPTHFEVDGILEILKSTKSQPVFIHCKHGEDRTGLAIGLYRVEIEGWDASDAYREMLNFNFHKKYSALDNYFWERTSH
ncbi:MAG: YdeI/OmpD-associated family protein, partial [Bdellovibrionales bacterium]|nr:YdeI/OmpD-associated family protein [Bdellovibrionales bacterium]